MRTLGKRVRLYRLRGFESLPIRPPENGRVKPLEGTEYQRYSRGMSPFAVTPADSKHMPRQQGLLPRGTRWYSNFKVPLDLQTALGKTHVRESLGTSDYREACRRITYERARVTAMFEHTRRKLPASETPQTKAVKTILAVISEKEAYGMAMRDRKSVV